jgi:hypothetical protein
VGKESLQKEMKMNTDGHEARHNRRKNKDSKVDGK